MSIAAWLAMAAPAMAQFSGALGNPGMYAAPEAASGAFGAGAGNSAATQQQCSQSFTVGRDGPRSYCSPGRDTPNPVRR